MGLITTTGSFSQVVDATVRALVSSATEEQSSFLYGNTIAGMRDYEIDVPSGQISDYSGPGRGTLTVEGQQYGSNEKYKGYPMSYQLRKYTSELSWTEEDLHWLQKASSSKQAIDLKGMASDAIQALYQNINEDLCKVFYLGFGTTFLTGGNSESLFGTHTIRKTGATQRNTFASGSTHRPFGSDALTDAVTILNRLKAHNNIELSPVRRVRVLCSKELAPEVDQVIASTYGPNNGNLGLQTASAEAFKRRGIAVDYAVLSDMDSSYQNYWFVVDLDRAAKFAAFTRAWMPRLSEETEKSKGIFKSEASTLFGFAWSQATWCFGSLGDNSAI